MSNSDATRLVHGMKDTLIGLETNLKTFNEQSASAFISGINPNMDRTREIQDLQTRLREHRKTQHRLISGAKRTIREDFKVNIQNRLRQDISTRVKSEIALQVREQVNEQIREYIPVPLQQQVLENRKQISDIKISLHNSEARARNSALKPTNFDEPLMPLYKLDGSKSHLNPADLRSLFAYDLDIAKELVRDFGMEADDHSLQVNYGRFMRHIGIENVCMAEGTQLGVV
ncbi:hypothetical protein E4T56_gene10456 [Termitomyces sp. T112]|nr:hypothetical protein E4T56_gene10456 [Termitomyces sp. T112]KAH0588770.1 hypothetical protein H2248_004571 [Termitomyces sp. 'cryptogamus']